VEAAARRPAGLSQPQPAGWLVVVAGDRSQRPAGVRRGFGPHKSVRIDSGLGS
jgi:hypothetical protein